MAAPANVNAAAAAQEAKKVEVSIQVRAMRSSY